MSRPLLVVPHGTGIGDVVNLRPLLGAIVAHYPGREVQVLVPLALGWLLPQGSRAADGGPHGSPWTHIALTYWRRLGPDHRAVPLLRRMSARATARVVQPEPLRIAARGMTRFLQIQGFEVISLLEAFAGLNLDDRWTPGAWSADRRHVIDLLVERLEEWGIPVAERRPAVSIIPRPLQRLPSVILAPNAGSTLKEPPESLWVDVARGLRREGIEPFLLAAPKRRTAWKIAEQVTSVQVLGDGDLRNVAALLSGAGVVVSPDSGILHLTAATGTRYVGLFGSTDPLLHGPYDRCGGIILETAIEHAPICRGCWTAQLLPAARCALLSQGNCLSGIAAEQVVSAIQRLLAAPLPSYQPMLPSTPAD